MVGGQRHHQGMLDVRSCMTLDLERRRWKRPGHKAQAIRELFGETETRYHQRLNALLDDPAALAYAPTVVNRLRRLRDERRRTRLAS